MTSQVEVIRVVLAALAESKISYMIVGSFAASLYGVSRATHDLDVVVAITQDDVSRLRRALGDEFYFDEEAALDAIARSDMFNVLHIDAGLKVDFWIHREDDYGQSQLERRVETDIWGAHGYVASAEDTILSKLLWYKITPSDRQLADIKEILIVRKDALDYDYLKHWAVRLGVEDLLNRLIEET